MATDILMPKMGESVQEGTILRWLKQPGDRIERDEIIAEISTDKVDTEIPSSAEGTLLELLAQEGDTVEVGQVIARIGAENESAGSPAPSGSVVTGAADASPTAEDQPGQGDAREASVADEVTAETDAVAAGAGVAAADRTLETPQAQSGAPLAGSAGGASGGTRNEVLMPKMGESVQEGTILRWLKQPGDTVERDEVIAEISTDKVDTEIPSPFEGTLLEIAAQEGETVEVGKVIAYIGAEGSAPAQPAAPTSEPPKQEAPRQEAPKSEPPSQAPQAAVNQTAVNQAAVNGAGSNGNGAAPAPSRPASVPDAPSIVANGDRGPVPRVSNGRFYSPLVRTIAEKEGVGVAELDRIQGTGAEGRVTKGDLFNYLQNRPAGQPTGQPAGQQVAGRTAQPAAQGSAPSVKSAPQQPREYGADVEVVPMDRMRQLIAEHMVRSKATSPHVTEVGEADVNGLVRLRESRKASFEKLEGIKLTYTPFFVAAIAKALRDNPWVNASVDGTNVIVKKRVNVGVATALPDGNLIVPVIKDADRMNVSGLAHAINDLANRARNKQLEPDDVAGGTFTLTNYGVFGLLHGAPIINQPQVAILGAGAIQKRPVVREIGGEDLIVIRSMIYLSLSHDHRIIDGLLGGKFLADVIKNLESFDENSGI